MTIIIQRPGAGRFTEVDVNPSTITLFVAAIAVNLRWAFQKVDASAPSQARLDPAVLDKLEPVAQRDVREPQVVASDAPSA